MDNFTDVPNEILEHIFTHVSDINHPDIFTLRLVSKRFNEVAAPLRVRNWSDDGDYGHYSTSDSIVTLDRFALELLRYPELRSQVRNLKFTWIQTPHDHDPARVGLRSTNLELLAKAAEEALPDLAATTDLCQQIRRAWDDGIAVLVLVWTTNLKSLTLSIPPTPRDGDWHYFDRLLILRLVKQLALRFVAQHPRPTQALPLAKLQHLHFRYWGIGHWGPDHDINMRQLTPLLHFPSLKSLRVTCLGEDYEDGSVTYEVEDKYSMPYPKRTSSIESVVLATRNNTMSGLGNMLGACKNLKVFRANFMDSDEGEIRLHQRSVWLAMCLMDHASSLEEIDLPMYQNDTVWMTSRASSERGPEELVEHFQKFTALKRLSIPVSINYFGNDSSYESEWLTRDSYYEGEWPTPDSCDGREWLTPDSCYEREWLTPDRLPKSIEYLKFYDSLTPILKEFRLGKSAFVTEIGKALGVVTSIVAETGEKGRLSQLKYIDCTAVVCDDPEIKWVEELKETAKERGVQVVLGEYVSIEDAWQDKFNSF